ncbi:adhesion G protein-coupled receptor E5 isoform X3 [Eleutherodactylus coqui]|uniref:adhesion G protein-coupled receptor E5 isoform X3 n=1 Tax=Eleutherodactylus coqui TaxID=57060 RepID=UPI003461EAAD
MDWRFSAHLLLLIIGLTIHTIAQQGEKQCPNNWICPANVPCANTTLCRCTTGYYQCIKKGVILCKALSISTSQSSLSCPIRTLLPNETNCHNRICGVNETYDKSYPCIPGYGEDTQGDCTDIVECSTSTDACGAHTGCKNTVGGYRCKCNNGYQKDNQTEFCPSNDKKKNVCTDIDECSDDPGICGSNQICRNTPGSYYCTCAAGYKNISNTCIDECKTGGIKCGSNQICRNTPGSYYCTCTEGYKNISNRCVVECKYNMSSEPCADKPFQCKLKNFRNKFKPFCEDVPGQPEVSVEELLEDLDSLIDGFHYGNKTVRLQEAGTLLRELERTVQALARLEQKTKSYVNNKTTTSIQLSAGTSDSGTLLLEGIKSRISLDSKTAAGNTAVALLGCIEYTNIDHILEGADLLEENSSTHSFALVSPVVSIFLGIENTSSLRESVSMTLNFTKPVRSENLSCVSWSVVDNSWSSKGCVLVNRDNTGITCNCSHLTSFAVLMLLQDYESWSLTLITQIGLSISIFCLVLAIITFCFCRSIRGTRTTIHTHLCISLLLGNCIFLLGITASDYKVLCKIVAGLLHTFYLCSFCWMFLEGLELYRMLVTVFKTHLKKRYLLAVGYGTPAVIVTISAAIYPDGYGTEKHCWLSLERGFIWAFMGPVCVIILVNCGIFVLTVWKLAEKMSSVNPEQGKLKRIRTLTITSLAQLCILGSCWAFGFFMFSSATPFFIYAFTVLTTLQGLQIFCLHCLMHKKVRADYKRWLCAIAHFKSPVYSEFSNTSNSHTNTKGKKGKESGL